MKELSTDQWFLLVAQIGSVLGFAYAGHRADAAISAHDGASDVEVVSRALEGLGDYQTWDRYAGVLLAIVAILWLVGIIRAVHRRSAQHLALFALGVPALVGLIASISKLN